MRAAILLVSLLAAGPALAADLAAAPSPFETHFVPAVQNGLAADPFFASKLLQSFDFHMTAIASLPNDQAAAAYLKAQVKDVRLASRNLTESQAAAVLAAGALAAPRQFNTAASRLEAVKPGLGGKLIESFKASAHSGSYRAAGALVKAGQALRLTPDALTYNAKGEIERLFDGGKQP